eukprot:m.51158 g.51158  ORF g.51158 m.51158 type:complete len:109 (+) comp18124_c0_seq2:506-832(+)
MNFGFRNDPRGHGEPSHVVSCEYHANEGGYHEMYHDLGFNFRDDFHTYKIEHRPNSIKWLVDEKEVCSAAANLTHSMHTSLILRSNSQQSMPSAQAEYAYFKFTPWSE